MPEGIRRFQLVIPGWRPARTNELLSNRFKAGRLKKRDRTRIAYYARSQGIPKAKGKRRITLRITLEGRQRKVDQDGYWKSTLDACVKAGLLIDDQEQWVELMPLEYDSGESKTIIILEDL